MANKISYLSPTDIPSYSKYIWCFCKLYSRAYTKLKIHLGVTKNEGTFLMIEMRIKKLHSK